MRIVRECCVRGAARSVRAPEEEAVDQPDTAPKVGSDPPSTTLTRRSRRGRRGGESSPPPRRAVDYRHLVNPMTPQTVYSADQIEAIHAAALRVLREIGLRVLLPEARAILREAGAEVDETVHRVRLPSELVEACAAKAPPEFRVHGADQASSPLLGGRNVTWVPVGGAPHICDLDHGKRPGTLADTENIIRLSQHFDVIHLMSPNVEPQDVPVAVRHYAVNRAQLLLGSKPPFLYSRGTPQVRDGFEMARLARGLSASEFEAAPHVWTVINTNSPLSLDIPMLQGLIDFARSGQLAVITPFTLAGAMAPASIAGALVQQHAELLAALAVSQLARPGAPVMYGGFTSNVDMKSGSPAFGTPEYVRAAWATGQLARRLKLPWRSSMSCTSNCVDVQSAYESQMALWGATLGGANMVLHAAGWLEGGLTGSMEKFIVDVEMLQQMAELMQPVAFDEEELALDAIAEVGPGGHFFGAAHTLRRYQTAFYTPLLSDWSNFGQWTDGGAKDATQRANGLWKRILADFEPPPVDVARVEALDDFIARRTAAGGAPAES